MFISSLLFLSLCTQVSDKPKVRYDKIEDVTYIDLEFKDVPVRQGFHIDAQLFAKHDGDVRKNFAASDHVRLGFARYGTKLKYQNDHDVEILCGPELVPILSVDYMFNEPKEFRACQEYISVYLKFGTLKKFLERDRDWQVKIGSDDSFVFDHADRRRMLAFVKFLEEGGG
jgi:hypothetical protein